MRWSVKVWKVWRPCRTEARAVKRRPALTPISASVGEGKNNKLTAAGRQACDVQNLGRNGAHKVEYPIADGIAANKPPAPATVTRALR